MKTFDFVCNGTVLRSLSPSEMEREGAILATGLMAEVVERDATQDEELAECRRLRSQAYPPLSDLADALVHEANGDPAPKAAYVSACLAVKAQFPKPAPEAPPSQPTDTSTSGPVA